MQVIDKVVEKIRDAGLKFDPSIQVAPACILWPDREREWEKALPLFLERMPELLIFGDYSPTKHTGPAVWLRCVIANKSPDLELPPDKTPIIYLPGVSRQELRQVENIREGLKPLAELQFRGVIWSNGNKDWTAHAYLKVNPFGFPIQIMDNTETKTALLNSLKALLKTEIESLENKSLDKEFFNNLLESDYVDSMLQWLNQKDEFKSTLSEEEWRAFNEICKSKLSFNPDKEGYLTAATKLASCTPSWDDIWKRFCFAPNRYPNIPALIKQCKPPKSLLWQNPSQRTFDRWPQYNQEQENSLRKELKSLKTLPPHKARDQTIMLEKEHGYRRNLIWAELAETPNAQALKHLAILSNITANPINSLTAGTAEDLSITYQNKCWLADKAMLQALEAIEKQEDIEGIQTALIAIYKPWAENAACYFQKITYINGYPGCKSSAEKAPKYEKGECLLFVDGLRFDVAKWLTQMLTDKGYRVEEKVVWAAIPSVTATAKPAVTPIRDKISGDQENTEFIPIITATGSLP